MYVHLSGYQFLTYLSATGGIRQNWPWVALISPPLRSLKLSHLVGLPQLKVLASLSYARLA